MDSVQWLSNIKLTEWVSGSKHVEGVNGMLQQGWALLAAGVDPHGEPTWLLGRTYFDDTEGATKAAGVWLTADEWAQMIEADKARDIDPPKEEGT